MISIDFQVGWRFIRQGCHFLLVPPAPLSNFPTGARHWWTVVHHPEMAGWCTTALQQWISFIFCECPGLGTSINFHFAQRSIRNIEIWQEVKQRSCKVAVQFFFTRLWTRQSFCFSMFFSELFFSIYISFCLPNHNFLLWPSYEQTQLPWFLWSMLLQYKVRREENEDVWSHTLTSQLNACTPKCCWVSIWSFLFMMRGQETRQETASWIDGCDQIPINHDIRYLYWCLR